MKVGQDTAHHQQQLGAGEPCDWEIGNRRNTGTLVCPQRNTSRNTTHYRKVKYIGTFWENTGTPHVTLGTEATHGGTHVRPRDHVQG